MPAERRLCRSRAGASVLAGTVAALLLSVVPSSPAPAQASDAAQAGGGASGPAGARPGGVVAVVDPTRTRKARASRAHRRTIPLEVWAASPYARMIVRRESGGSCTVVNWAGPYRGRWQMSDALWRAFGGLDYAPHPEKAACEEQDAVAYRIWIAVGWSPWGG